MTGEDKGAATLVSIIETMDIGQVKAFPIGREVSVRNTAYRMNRKHYADDGKMWVTRADKTAATVTVFCASRHAATGEGEP